MQIEKIVEGNMKKRREIPGFYSINDLLVYYYALIFEMRKCVAVPRKDRKFIVNLFWNIFCIFMSSSLLSLFLCSKAP